MDVDEDGRRLCSKVDFKTSFDVQSVQTKYLSTLRKIDAEIITRPLHRFPPKHKPPQLIHTSPTIITVRYILISLNLTFF